MATEERAPTWDDYSSILRRRWKYAVTIAPAVILIAVYFAFALPAEFQSSATIMLEPSSVQKDLIETTVATYADRQIEIVKSRVMTLDALKQLVNELDPYPDEPDLDKLAKAQRIIERTTFERVDPVTGKTLLESTAFALHYTNHDPKRAAAVASKLADLFLTYNQRTRAEAAKQATTFLAEQAKSLSQELHDVDAELAQLKDKYGDALPDAQRGNDARLDGARRDLQGYERELRLAEEKESTLSLQLNDISPNLVALGGDLTDINKVKAQLAEAEQRYTPDHPDVKRLRRAMEDLLAKNASGANRAVKPNNPDYLRVQAQLEGARKEVAALRAATARTNQEISAIVRDIASAPAVEREFNEVNRRREALQSKFQQLQNQLQNAQLAQSFESESRGERFTLVNAPFPAKLPVSPNRIGLILLGLVLGFGLSAGAVFIAESSDPAVRGPADFPAGMQDKLLGAVPIILTSSDRRRHVLIWSCVAGIYGIAVIVVGFTIVTAVH